MVAGVPEHAADHAPHEGMRHQLAADRRARDQAAGAARAVSGEAVAADRCRFDDRGPSSRRAARELRGRLEPFDDRDPELGERGGDGLGGDGSGEARNRHGGPSWPAARLAPCGRPRKGAREGGGAGVGRRYGASTRRAASAAAGRRSQRGAHQFQAPSSCMVAGTSSARTRRDVERDGRADTDTDLLHIDERARGEGADHHQQDQRGARDDPAGVREAGDHALAVVARAQPLFADPRQQEDLVVHREPEDDREDHERNRRVDALERLEAEQPGAVPVLEHPDEQAEARAEREHVHEHGLERHHDRAERDDQHQEVPADHRTRPATRPYSRRVQLEIDHPRGRAADHHVEIRMRDRAHGFEHRGRLRRAPGVLRRSRRAATRPRATMRASLRRDRLAWRRFVLELRRRSAHPDRDRRTASARRARPPPRRSAPRTRASGAGSSGSSGAAVRRHDDLHRGGAARIEARGVAERLVDAPHLGAVRKDARVGEHAANRERRDRDREQEAGARERGRDRVSHRELADATPERARAGRIRRPSERAEVRRAGRARRAAREAAPAHRSVRSAWRARPRSRCCAGWRPGSRSAPRGSRSRRGPTRRRRGPRCRASRQRPRAPGARAPAPPGSAAPAAASSRSRGRGRGRRTR